MHRFSAEGGFFFLALVVCLSAYLSVDVCEVQAWEGAVAEIMRDD